MTPVLEMKNVEKHFGGVRAIDNFSVSLDSNCIHGLIGPNGAGKTTIFNNITGIYTPDAGQILFNGTDITKTPPFKVAQMGIARTFQNIRLFSNLSVIQNVIIARNLEAKYNLADTFLRNAKYHKISKETEEKAFELLKVVGLEDKAYEKSSSLPYGHQRKLEIARAMALDPKLLLLDEPAAGMNADESLELVSFIKEIRDKFGITILMIEHHMDVISSLCDSVTVLSFGKTIAAGTPAEVKRNKTVIEAYLGGVDDDATDK
ncbi:MAG: ABC transporter ATP-binding protein [Candidatus Metalachnospira sp.]|nr:ABC transporter ATP-binding protein [Candidatus Metalachnospira sp.]